MSTSVHFVYVSMQTNKCCPVCGNGPQKSIATSFQGVSLVGIVCNGSGGLPLVTAWHAGQLSISSFTSTSIFGYQIFVRNKLFGFSIP